MTIVLYVDDLLITRNDKDLIQQTRKALSIEFEMKDLGLLHYYLGIEFWQKLGEIFVSQQKYAKEILKAFGMSKCKEIGTLMEVDTKLSNVKDTSPLADIGSYIKLVGSFIYLCNTRLDIAFSIGVLSKFSNKPHGSHWNAGMWIPRYLKGTLSFGTTYGASTSFIGHCDSDWVEMWIP